MSIPKVRIFYILSLVILAALVIFIFFQPASASGNYTEVLEEQLLETNSEWIIQVNIINNEGTRQNYTINVLANNKEYTEDISIKDGRTFAFIHHIRRETIGEGDVTLSVYQEGKGDPIEQLVYHMR